MLAAAIAADPVEPELVARPVAPPPEAAPEAPARARKTRKPPPARKARRKAEPAAPAAATAERPAVPSTSPAPDRPLFVPTVSYERQADMLRIELLDEPVSDERRSEKLNAGYTADGRLAGLQIFDVARHAAPSPPMPAPPARPASAPDPLLAAKLDKLHEELRILKTSLVLALGGLAIVLLKLF